MAALSEKCNKTFWFDAREEIMGEKNGRFYRFSRFVCCCAPLPLQLTVLFMVFGGQLNDKFSFLNVRCKLNLYTLSCFSKMPYPNPLFN